MSEEVKEYRDLVQKIIDTRQDLDLFLESGDCYTFRGDVAVELEEKIKNFSAEADEIIALLDLMEE